MTKPAKGPLLEYWYQALTSPHGIELICSQAESIKTMLYIARKEAQDPDLNQVKVSISPFDPTRVWLVKKESINATP